MRTHVVIIGAGIAGVQAAQSLAGEMRVTLINREPFVPYYRMRLEEVVTGGNPASIFMHPASWYEEKGIELIENEAVGIDEEGKAVRLSDSSQIEYDALVIATGSKANIFPISGVGRKYYPIRSLTDAFELRYALEKSSNACIIGGGLLGLELACAIAGHKNIPVSVIETAPYILPKQLDEDSAALLSTLLKERGVTIIAGASVKEAHEKSLILENGDEIAADTVIFSAGVHNDLSLLDGTSIERNRGIVVDARLRTSSPSIWAIGDVAELDGRTFGLAMHAREMGLAAARSIRGEDVMYVPSAPSSVLKVGNLDVSFFGEMKGRRIVKDGEKSRRTFFVEDGVLRGAIYVAEKAPLSIKAKIGQPFEEEYDR